MLSKIVALSIGPDCLRFIERWVVSRHNASWVLEDETRLFNILNQSRQDQALRRYTAKIVTLLNFAGVSFSGRDLSGLELSGADLSDAVCHGTDFSNSNLQNARFNGAILINANFKGANMEGVSAGLKPNLCSEIYQGNVEQTTYSPDGEHLISLHQPREGTKNGQVVVWDLRTSLPIFSLPIPEFFNSHIAYIQDGFFVVALNPSYGQDEKTKLILMSIRQKMCHQIEELNCRISSIITIPNSSRFLVMTYSKSDTSRHQESSPRLINNDSLILEYDLTKSISHIRLLHENRMNAVTCAVILDEHTLVLGDYHGNIRLCRFNEGADIAELSSIRIANRKIRAINHYTVSSDTGIRTHFYVGSEDSESQISHVIYLHTDNQFMPPHTFQSPFTEHENWADEGLRSLKLHSSKKCLLATYAKSLILWDISKPDKNEPYFLSREPYEIKGVSFSDKANEFSYGVGFSIMRFDMILNTPEQGVVTKKTSGHSSELSSLSVSSRFLASASQEKVNLIKFPLNGHFETITNFSSRHNSRGIIATAPCSRTNAVYLLDREGNVYCQNDLFYNSNELLFSVGTCEEGSIIKISDDGKMVAIFNGKESSIFSKEANSSYQKKELRLLGINSSNPLDRVRSIAFSPNSSYLLLGTFSGDILRVDCQNPENLTVSPLLENKVSLKSKSMKFSDIKNKIHSLIIGYEKKREAHRRSKNAVREYGSEEQQGLDLHAIGIHIERGAPNRGELKRLIDDSLLAVLRNFEKVWSESCRELDIDPETARSWANKLIRQFNRSPERYYCLNNYLKNSTNPELLDSLCRELEFWFNKFIEPPESMLGGIKALEWISDDVFISLDSYRSINVYQLEKARLTKELPNGVFVQGSTRIKATCILNWQIKYHHTPTTLALNRPFNIVSVGYLDGSVQFFEYGSDFSSFYLTQSIKPHHSRIQGVSFSPCGNYFFSASTEVLMWKYDSDIKRWVIDNRIVKLEKTVICHDCTFDRNGAIHSLDVLSPTHSFLTDRSSNKLFRLLGDLTESERFSLIRKMRAGALSLFPNLSRRSGKSIQALRESMAENQVVILTGKTEELCVYAAEFYNITLADRSNDVIPIVFTLKNHGVNELFETVESYFTKLGFYGEALLKLKQNPRIVFIINGYWDLTHQSAIDGILEVGSWAAKFIVLWHKDPLQPNLPDWRERVMPLNPSVHYNELSLDTVLGPGEDFEPEYDDHSYDISGSDDAYLGGDDACKSFVDSIYEHERRLYWRHNNLEINSHSYVNYLQEYYEEVDWVDEDTKESAVINQLYNRAKQLTDFGPNVVAAFAYFSARGLCFLGGETQSDLLKLQKDIDKVLLIQNHYLIPEIDNWEQTINDSDGHQKKEFGRLLRNTAWTFFLLLNGIRLSGREALCPAQVAKQVAKYEKGYTHYRELALDYFKNDDVNYKNHGLFLREIKRNFRDALESFQESEKILIGNRAFHLAQNTKFSKHKEERLLKVQFQITYTKALLRSQ